MFKKPIRVYYGTLQNDGMDMHLTEPVSAYSLIKNNHPKSPTDDHDDHMWKICPSISDYYDNVYAITAPERLRLHLEEGRLVSPDLTPENYNRRMNIHSSNANLFGIAYGWFFAADTDSLIVEQLHPVMSGSDFSHKVDVVQGHLDCAKYYRGLEVAFKLKPTAKDILIQPNDPLFYLKFLTDQKIEFVRFIADRELIDFASSHTGLATRVKGKRSVLKAHYDLFERSKARKRILKMIKERA